MVSVVVMENTVVNGPMPLEPFDTGGEGRCCDPGGC